MQQMFAQCMNMMNMMGGMMDGGMMGALLWPALAGTLLLIALVVVGGALLLRALSNRTNSVRQQPLRILQERFARGELDAEEYQYRLSILQGRGS
jgi:uncharacterized membrane protein